MTSAKLTAALLKRLSERKLSACVLRNYESLPDLAGHDLDMAVSRSQLPELIDIIVGLGGERIVPVQWFCRRHAWKLDLSGTEQGDQAVVHVDWCTEGYGWRGLLFLTNREVLAQAVAHDGYRIPRPAHEACISLLWPLLHNGGVKRAYFQKIVCLAREDTSEFCRVLRCGFGRKLARLVFAGVLEGRADLIDRACGSLRLALVLNSLYRQPFSSARRVLCHAFEKLTYAVRPNKLAIALIGPDGVGKTTVAAHIAGTLRRVFLGLAYCHWRPAPWRALSRKVPDAGGLTDHAIRRPRLVGRVASAARLCASALVFALGYWTRVFPAKLANKLVILDRYCYAYLLWPESVRYYGPKWLARLALWFVPKPDLALFLTAPPDTVRARKPELDEDEIVRQIERGRKLAAGDPRVVEIDASSTIDETARRAVRVVIEHLAERTSRRLGGQHGFRVLRTAGVDRVAVPVRPRAARTTALAIHVPSTGFARLGHRIARMFPGPMLRIFSRPSLEPGQRLGKWNWCTWLDEVARVLGRGRLAPAFYYPPQEDRQKAGVLLTDDRGAPVAFAKLAWDEASNAELEREAKALGFVESLRPKAFRTPKLLAQGEWEGRSYNLYSPLPPNGRGAPTKWAPPYQTAWCELRERTGTRKKLAGLLWWPDLRGHGGAWQKLADTVEKSEPAGGYEFCAAHGDLAPWNARRDKGRLWLFDWEESASEAPVLLDPMHFLLRLEMHLRKRTPARAVRSVLALLQDTCIPDSPRAEARLALAFFKARGHGFLSADLDMMAMELRDA